MVRLGRVSFEEEAEDDKFKKSPDEFLRLFLDMKGGAATCMFELELILRSGMVLDPEETKPRADEDEERGGVITTSEKSNS